MQDSNKPHFGQGDSSYRNAGEWPGLLKLVQCFYQLMSEKQKYAELQAMHTRQMDDAVDRLTCFLSAWLGGPRLYAEKYGPINIPMMHQPLGATTKTTLQWLECMAEAIEEQPYTPEFKTYLNTQFKVPATRILQVSETKD